MTEKKEKILQTALELFARQGYDATSTSKVAKAAGVSEGLIFRHFESKEGLLKAILEEGRHMALDLYQSILSQSDPKAVLRGILEMPFRIDPAQYPFWRLLYALKWRSEIYDQSLSAPLKKAMVQVFEQLNYPDPDAEAETLLLIIDGIAYTVLLRKPENKEAILAALLRKYPV